MLAAATSEIKYKPKLMIEGVLIFVTALTALFFCVLKAQFLRATIRSDKSFQKHCFSKPRLAYCSQLQQRESKGIWASNDN